MEKNMEKSIDSEFVYFPDSSQEIRIRLIGGGRVDATLVLFNSERVKYVRELSLGNNPKISLVCEKNYECEGLLIALRSAGFEPKVSYI